MLRKAIFSVKNHIFAAFIPWIFFALFYGASTQSIVISSVGALVLVFFFNFTKLQKGFVLPWGSALLFAFVALNALGGFVKLDALGNVRLINSALAAIVLFSMLIGKPFTLQYAKEEVDSTRWRHPHFRRINWILTGIWAVLMVVMALPSYFLTYEQLRDSWFWSWGLMIVCIVVGVRCNKRLPKMLHK